MANIVIAGTDFGYMVKRSTTGVWTKTYTGLVTSNAGTRWLFNGPSELWVEDPQSSGPGHVLHSTDKGDTWIVENEGTVSGGGDPAAIGAGHAQDTVTGDILSFGSASPITWFKSSDRGQTWDGSPFYTDSAGTNPSKPVFASTKLWWTRRDTTSGPGHLEGVKSDGTGHVEIGGFSAYVPGTLHGTPGIPRLYAYSSTAGDGKVLVSIDISDPTTPTATGYTTATVPFGTHQAVIMPLTASVVIAFEASGSTHKLYRSTDAGATWSNILTNADLDGLDNFKRFPGALIGNEVWICGTLPHFFHSTDLGATWTEEDYNGPSLGSSFEWSCITLTAGAPPVFPGFALYPAAGGTAIYGPAFTL